MTISVQDKDKPFVLALVASGITIINIILAALGGFAHNDVVVTTSVDAMKYTFTLTASAWTFYFGQSKANSDKSSKTP